MPAADVLKDAISKKLQVTATYDGFPREFCPHAIGWKSPTEKKPSTTYHVIGYQFGGSSRSGLPPGGQWRCFEVHGLSNVASRPGAWHTGDDHTRPNTCMDPNRIELEVAH